MTSKEGNFKRKIAIIFPCLKELKRPELEELHKEIIHEETNEKGENINLPLQDSSETYVYMIKNGVFEIFSETNRAVKFVSNSDIFGLYQLIAKDVKMTLKPIDETKFYKVPLPIFEKFMGAYPFLSKTLYSRAILNYLKCCSSSLARTKSRYFRRIRRLSPTYFSNILEDGEIIDFENSDAILDFLYQGHFSSVGFFCLKGSFKIVHSDPSISKAKQLFKIQNLSKIREFLRNKINSSSNISKSDNIKKKLTEDYYSIKKFDKNFFEEDNNLMKMDEINPGNAVKIHPDFLEKIEFIDSEIKLFVIEAVECQTKIKQFAKDYSSSKQINRRTII